MDATTASLIGAGIGALAGLAGGWLNGWRQSKLEYEKWVRSRQEALEKDARLALADLTKKIAAGIHAIAWVTWKAKNEPDRFSESDFTAYDTTINTLFPDIVGSRVALAALNKSAHDQMSPLVQHLYDLDVAIGNAAAEYRKVDSAGIKALAECHSQAIDFDKLLLQEATKIGIPDSGSLTASRT